MQKILEAMEEINVSSNNINLLGFLYPYSYNL